MEQQHLYSSNHATQIPDKARIMFARLTKKSATSRRVHKCLTTGSAQE